MLATSGVLRASASNRSRVNGTPARRAIAIRCTTELVDPPSASAVVIALSTLPAVMKSRGFRSDHTMSTMRRPVSVAILPCRESAAGIDAAPGSVKPSASAADVIVDAVPIVMQCPGERAMPSWSSSHCRSLMLPARFSAQYFHTSEPLPNSWSRQWPESIGPAGMKIAGRFMLMAPISNAGVVLSQPPISTAPSTGYERSSSSVSSASRLRYSIVVGFWNTSASAIAGISSGNPPACSTPRLTSSARCLKCEWQALMSLQVLMTAMIGLPM